MPQAAPGMSSIQARSGWAIEELMEKTILAMRSYEDAVNEAVSAL